MRVFLVALALIAISSRTASATALKNNQTIANSTDVNAKATTAAAVEIEITTQYPESEVDTAHSSSHDKQNFTTATTGSSEVVSKKPAILGNNTPGRKKNWWQGSHVCTRVNLSRAAVSSSVSTVIVSNGEETVQLTQQCVNAEDTYFCSVERLENGEKVVETTTYECCSGYQHSKNPRYGNRCVRSRPKRE